MATVTVIVTLRKIEGRRKVDLDALADAVADHLAGIEGDLIEAYDLDGGELTYEISGARLVTTGGHALADENTEQPACEWCAEPVANDRHGRARRYCSDAHRQAAYRARRRTPA